MRQLRPRTRNLQKIRSSRALGPGTTRPKKMQNAITVDSLITHTPHNAYSLITHNFGSYQTHQENNTLLGSLELLESAGLTGLTRASFKFL